MLRHQAFLYFPILLVARVSWLIQSAMHVIGMRTHPWGQQYPIDAMHNAGIELFTLALYYVWYIGLMYVTAPL